MLLTRVIVPAVGSALKSGVTVKFGVELRVSGAVMEVAGAQCLLLAGFFEDQMRGRHNIGWYATLGAGFFRRAAAHEPTTRKAQVLDAIGRRFEPWRQTHARLGRELRDRPYLLPKRTEP